MKSISALTALLVLAGSTVALGAGPADDVKAAAKMLSDKGAYAWKSTVEAGGGGGGGGRGRMGPTEGKISKDGVAHMKMTRGDNSYEAVIHGTKGALKTEDGWQSLAELSEGGGGGGGGFNPGRFMARTLQNFKAPASEAADLADKAKNLTSADGAIAGELPAEVVRGLLSFGGRGGQGPEISGAKGKVKFWMKDGVLAKYQYQVQGTMSFNGNDRDIDRTTTVEIKDVGTATVEVPEAAKKKIS